MVRERASWTLLETLTETGKVRSDSELMGDYLGPVEAWTEVRSAAANKTLRLRGHRIIHDGNHPFRLPAFVGFIPPDDVWPLWPVTWKDGLALVNELVAKELNKLRIPLDLVRFELEAWVNVEVPVADWHKVFSPDSSAAPASATKRKPGPKGKGDAVVAAYRTLFPAGRPAGTLKRTRNDLLRQHLGKSGYRDIFDEKTLRTHLREIDP
jgi:hypothetical protein